jgi:hypothetical protein
MKTPKSIRGLFSLPGFVAENSLKGVFGDRYARVIVLRRRKKLASAPAAVTDVEAGTTSARCVSAISGWRSGGSTSKWNAGVCGALGVARCS